MKWMRFQPPGPGLAPSGIGRPAELFGPDEQQPEVAPLDIGERGRGAGQQLEAEQLGVEGDRLLDVIDHVANIDDLIVGHCVDLLVVAGWVEQVEPEADARLELGRGAFERRVRGTVGRTLERRVGNAPVHELGAGRELGADLSNAVAQRDHRVEPLGDELVEVLGAVRADVDATLAAGRGRRWDAAASDGCPRSPLRSPRPTCARAAPRRSGTARCSPCTGTTPAAGDANARSVDGSAGSRCEPQRGMQRTARGLQRLPAGGEVDGVVAVAAVRRTATRRHEPTVAELTQVVRHQALRLVDQHRQLPDGPIALHQLSQQPPPQRMRRQPHERRRVADRGTGCDGRLHRTNSTRRSRNPIKPD